MQELHVDFKTCFSGFWRLLVSYTFTNFSEKYAAPIRLHTPAFFMEAVLSSENS